jgi:1-acyl-sn-glycerol-3-phosphate acyltransferase
MSEAADYPRANPLVYRAIRSAFRLFFRVVARQTVKGIETLPASGPFILASNHLSFLDGPLILTRTPAVIHGVVGAEYRDHVFGPLCTALGCVYVHRGMLDRTAVRLCRRILDDGGILAVAIEGTRSRTGSLMDGKNGVAWLANHSHVPVVPVAVFGTEALAPNLKRLRRGQLHATFGTPLHFPPGPLTTAELHQCTSAIMTALAGLLPEPYRCAGDQRPEVQLR